MRKIFFVRSALLVLCFALSGGLAQAQTSAFTYQGKLTDMNAAANGNYDFVFRLFDAAENGTQIGTDAVLDDVPVTGGIFTVNLDFGASAFANGAARFLEISVRPGTGADAYTLLLPRQQVKSAPYSIKSLEAANAETSTNSLQLGGVAANQFVLTTDARLADARNPLPNSPNYIQNTTTEQTSSSFNISGNGTVGTNLFVGQNITVGSSLNVSANVQIANNLSVSSINASGTLTAGTTSLGSLTATSFTTGGNAAVGGNTFLNGNLGIGVVSPAARLHVSGSGIFTNNLFVDGNTTVGNSLSVAAAGSFGSSLSANSLSVTGNLTAGNSTLGNLNASSLTTTGNLGVQGNATIGGNAALGGILRLGAFTTNPATCTAGTAGTIYYRTNNPAIVLCNGTNWVRLTSVEIQPISQERPEKPTETVSEQQAQINRQEKQIENQQQQIDALRRLVCELKPEAAICKEEQK